MTFRHNWIWRSFISIALLRLGCHSRGIECVNHKVILHKIESYGSIISLMPLRFLTENFFMNLAKEVGTGLSWIASFKEFSLLVKKYISSLMFTQPSTKNGHSQTGCPANVFKCEIYSNHNVKGQYWTIFCEAIKCLSQRLNLKGLFQHYVLFQAKAQALILNRQKIFLFSVEKENEIQFSRNLASNLCRFRDMNFKSTVKK